MTLTLSDLLCQYHSVRYIGVKDVKLSIIYWLTVVGLLFYVVAYTIIIQKGYQSIEQVTGTTTMKWKGTGSIGDESGPVSALLPLDKMDLGPLPKEANAFFVATARVITPNQTRQMDCAGNEDVPECTPDDASKCRKNLYNWKNQGVYTGECGRNGRCLMHAWCPLEDDSNVQTIHGVGAFSTFVKVHVEFPKFGVRRHNVYDRDGSGDPIWGYNLFSFDEMVLSAPNFNDLH